MHPDHVLGADSTDRCNTPHPRRPKECCEKKRPGICYADAQKAVMWGAESRARRCTRSANCSTGPPPRSAASWPGPAASDLFGTGARLERGAWRSAKRSPVRSQRANPCNRSPEGWVGPHQDRQPGDQSQRRHAGLPGSCGRSGCVDQSTAAQGLQAGPATEPRDIPGREAHAPMVARADGRLAQADRLWRATLQVSHGAIYRSLNIAGRVVR